MERSCRRHSIPSGSGMFMSTRQTSKDRSLASAMAATVPSAVVTSKPADLRATTNADRPEMRSSTHNKRLYCSFIVRVISDMLLDNVRPREAHNHLGKEAPVRTYVESPPMRAYNAPRNSKTKSKATV